MAVKKKIDPNLLEDRETHGEHRKRMKEKFQKNGPEIFNDHELLEMLLYFAQPRIDTNPVAHRLLSTFGGLKNVFEAPLDALTAVRGVGENIAMLIKLCRELAVRCRRQEEDYMENSYVIASGDDAINFFKNGYYGLLEEVVRVAFLDNSGRVINFLSFPPGQVNASRLDNRAILRAAANTNAAAVVLAHNHPYGFAEPSKEDITATYSLYSVLNGIRVELFDHVIIAENGKGWSMRDNGNFSAFQRQLVR